jgi:hypothetical protein
MSASWGLTWAQLSYTPVLQGAWPATMTYHLVLVPLAPVGTGLFAAFPGAKATESPTKVVGALIGAAAVDTTKGAVTGAAEATAGAPMRIPGMAAVGAPIATVG